MSLVAGGKDMMVEVRRMPNVYGYTFRFGKS